MHVSVAAPVQVSALPAPSLRHKFHTDAKIKRPTQKGRFLALYSVMMSCRKAPPEFRFASSILRNFVPSGAAHEAAAGHALSEPSDNYTATFSNSYFISGYDAAVYARNQKHMDKKKKASEMIQSPSSFQVGVL